MRVWRKVGSVNLVERRKANPSLQWFFWTQSTSSYKCLVTMSKLESERFSTCLSRCVFSCRGESQTNSSHWRQAYKSYSWSWSSVSWHRSCLWHVDRLDLSVLLSLKPIGLSPLTCWVQQAKGQKTRGACLTPVWPCHYRSTWHCWVTRWIYQRLRQLSMHCWWQSQEAWIGLRGILLCTIVQRHLMPGALHCHLDTLELHWANRSNPMSPPQKSGPW